MAPCPTLFFHQIGCLLIQARCSSLLARPLDLTPFVELSSINVGFSLWMQSVSLTTHVHRRACLSSHILANLALEYTPRLEMVKGGVVPALVHLLASSSVDVLRYSLQLLVRLLDEYDVRQSMLELGGGCGNGALGCIMSHPLAACGCNLLFLSLSSSLPPLPPVSPKINKNFY